MKFDRPRVFEWKEGKIDEPPWPSFFNNLVIVENPEEAIKGKRFADQNAESNAQLSWCRWIGSDGGGGGVRLRGHAVGVGLIEEGLEGYLERHTMASALVPYSPNWRR
uniref:Uncharacterized protein n=1 Tax=Cucumis sativus TaxID=3659 RepID=A0A0A0LYS5_CUCSA